MPSSRMISSVDGWIVSPRKSRRKSPCFSSTTTRTPARASSRPSIMPAGPPPTTQQFTKSLTYQITNCMECGGRMPAALGVGERGRLEQQTRGLLRAQLPASDAARIEGGVDVEVVTGRVGEDRLRQRRVDAGDTL